MIALGMVCTYCTYVKYYVESVTEKKLKSQLLASLQSCGLIYNFFVFHLILMKLGEVVVIHVHYNFTKFHQNRMTNKKGFLIARFSVHNFKVGISRIAKIVHSAPGPLVQKSNFFRENLYGTFIR